MTAVVAPHHCEMGGEEETKEEGMDEVIKALAQILGSDTPENTFLDAVSNGVIPDEVCLELAEHLGELVKVVDLDNRLEVVAALRESGAISEKTQEILLLAILEMDEQEETETEVGDELTEITVTIIPLSAPPLEPSAEGQTGQAQAPAANSVADLIRSAAELQAQFGKNLPEEKLSEVRQAVGKLTEEEFASLRQILGSAILAQAEVPAAERTVDVAASLEVVDILLGQRQTELTAATFASYETLASEGFRLTLRNEFGRPLMVVASISLLRNRFQRWLDSRESGPPNQSLRDATGQVGEKELASAQKTITTLEGFLLAAADDRIKTAIQEDHASRLREKIVTSWIRVLDAISEELVAAQPATKEEALNLQKGYLNAKRRELASELRSVGSKSLGEAEATIRRIFDLRSACAALRREITKLVATNYDPVAQRPVLSDREKQLAFLEIKRKEDVSSLRKIEDQIKAGVQSGELAGKRLEKAYGQRDWAIAQLKKLDRLITNLRPAPTLEVRHG